ncbi:MAG: PrsW family glutamic-type intramembrane protease [Candidatus Paceibacterota bacterium]|jgi:RsiW-degrading membrane proteinase PrsW (M82 family)|nr:PrsW family glutamic-type intramembrane protease [bacterium]
MDYKIFLYLFLAITPGILWLIFFLRKDNHPEPKIKLFTVFYFGMIVVLLAAFIELQMLKHIDLSSPTITEMFGTSAEPTLFFYGIKYVFIVGIIEEVLKYLVVRFLILKKSCIDEPIDLPIYMITAAIGFAVGENLLLFFYTNPINAPGIAMTRFIGANLLHIVCSAIIGITLAVSFYNIKKRYLILFVGFVLSIVTHALFDFCIQLFIINEDSIIILAPYILTGTLSILVIIGLQLVKKMKGVCKID